MKRKHTFLFFSIMAVTLLGSCDEKRMYQNIKTLPDETWLYDSALVFDFPVSQVQEPVNLSFAVRNTLDYPHYNLFVQYEIYSPSGDILKSGLSETNLMQPQTGEPNGQQGKPTGQGTGYYYNHLCPLLINHRFEEAGNHQLKLTQYMRLDTLPAIAAVGVILDKSELAE